jgi:hypothetical protein
MFDTLRYLFIPVLFYILDLQTKMSFTINLHFSHTASISLRAL